MEGPDLSQEKGGKGKQKKMAVRVDFTPMVDMNMLLICFFMLCTSMLKPQTMEIALPSNSENIKDEERNKVKESEAFTILLHEDNKVYYFEGMPDEKSVKSTAYGKEGLRKLLLAKNAKAMIAAKKVREEFNAKAANAKSEEARQRIKTEMNEKLKEVKNADGVPNVIIKASDKATYTNLIDALDEMQICNIGKYVIDKYTDKEEAMVQYAIKAGA